MAKALAPRNGLDRRTWKLEDAKARLSEVVRRARNEGPQRVTVRGRDTVVIISEEELDRLRTPGERLSFVDFMASLSLDVPGLAREPDAGREPEL